MRGSNLDNEVEEVDQVMKSLKVAIIGGAGFMGKAHSFAWSLAAVQSASERSIVKQVLVEVDPDVAKRSATSLGWAEAQTDWKGVIDRDDIDIIDIVTPPHTHAEIASYAISRGKHVLSEKPLANDTAEALKLVESAEQADVFTQVGFNYRQNAAVQLAKQYLDEGRIGTVVQARFSYLQDAAFGDMGWRAFKATGGSGASSDIGSHIVDVANYLVGGIKRVAAKLQIIPTDTQDTHDVDDAGSFLAQFDSGVMGIFTFSQKSWGQNNHIRFEIDGTEGALAFDWNRRDELDVFLKNGNDAKGFTTVHADGTTPGSWFDLNGVGTGYLESSANQIIQFLEAIEGGRKNSPDFAEGTYVQSVIDAVWRSNDNDAAWIEIAGK